MRAASTLLPHISEISFPIQKRVEFGRLYEFDLVDPAGALGLFIDKLRLAGQRFVYAKDFAAYRSIEVACGLDRLDNANCAVVSRMWWKFLTSPPGRLKLSDQAARSTS
jgi:hypothetical protein